MQKHVIVVGGGPAGMEASACLVSLGHRVSLVEKSEQLGGHLLKWDHLFPDKRPAIEVLDRLNKQIKEGVTTFYNTELQSVARIDGRFLLGLNDGKILEADAVLISTGFDIFDAHRKEEYGYGIYDHVITSVDLEEILKNDRQRISNQSFAPKRIGIVHCVGSRDEKVGIKHCSKVCCVTGVKQSIELKEKFPEAQIFCFYMDLRMFGLGYEELYKEAQEKYGIRFIRGRLSEAFENQDGSVLLKVEDTLAGKPMKISVDLLVLLVGILPSEGTKKMKELFKLRLNSNGFLLPDDQHVMSNLSGIPGVFLAGSCKSPRNIEETLVDARAAAMGIGLYLMNKEY